MVVGEVAVVVEVVKVGNHVVDDAGGVFSQLNFTLDALFEHPDTSPLEVSGLVDDEAAVDVVLFA